MTRLKIKDYFITIGLEIHVALNTEKKLFSQSDNAFSMDEFALLDTATPGVLPVLNQEAVDKAVLFGLGVGARINQSSQFERKHYFYPDLSLGYQITQQTNPIVIGGVVPIEVNGVKKNIHIHHAHLECDAAKSIHTLYDKYSAIDISRGGTALIEIVSMPCMYSPQEAKAYAKEVYHLVNFLGICDGKLEEGSFRVDASISVSKKEDVLGTRVEIKNISSFQFIEEALTYEMHRQIECLEKGVQLILETRQFKEEIKETVSMREKETELDYRYLIDPDIPVVTISSEKITELSNSYVDYFSLKQLWLEYLTKYQVEMTSVQFEQGFLKYKDIFSSIQEKDVSERLLKMLFFWISDCESKKVFSITELMILLNSKLGAKEVKDVFQSWQLSDQELSNLMPQFLSTDEILDMAKTIIYSFTTQLEKARHGDVKMKQFLTGQCMSKLKGKAQAADIAKAVEQVIKSS